MSVRYSFGRLFDTRFFKNNLTLLLIGVALNCALLIRKNNIWKWKYRQLLEFYQLCYYVKRLDCTLRRAGFTYRLYRLKPRAKIQGGLQQTVVRIEWMVGFWSFRLNFVKNLGLNYYSWNLVLLNFRGVSARVFQRISMNFNMTVGQAACQLLCRYTHSTLVSSCVCWIVPIVMCDSIKRTYGCSCFECTWSVA